MIGNYKIVALCTNRIYDKECYEFVEEFSKQLSSTDMRLFVFNADIFDDSGNFRSSGSSDIFELISLVDIDILIIDEERLESSVTTEMLLKKAHDRKIPVIVIGEEHENCFNIRYNDDGFGIAVKHLIDFHGLKSLHMMAGKENNFFSDKRIAVFKKVLEEHGMPFDDSMVSYGGFWSEPAAAATERLISENRLPQGFICANDNMALAVIDTLKQNGYRVPEDVAVTGYDGIEEIKFSEPPLATVGRNDKKFAEVIIKLIPQVIAGKTGTEYVDPGLIRNHSCGCENTAKADPARYITAQNNRFNRYQDEAIVLTEASARIQMCDGLEEICYNMHVDDKMYAMCCLLKKECIDETIPPSTVLEKSFGDELFLLYDCDKIEYMKLHGEHFSPCPMPTSDIIPTLPFYLEDKRCMIFNSLSYLGVTLGYVCFHFSDHTGANYLKIPQTVTALNNAIGGFRNNRYQQYLVRQIEELYRTDSLTGLYNRRGFSSAYEKMLDNLDGKPLTAVLCDLDGLKQINDNFGHEEGDVAIRIAAQTLRKVCPECAVCTRFGGDEMFAVFPSEEIDVRERFNAELDVFNKNSGKQYEVSGSIGVITIASVERPTFEELLKKTDELMYAEKRRRKALKS